MYPGSAAPEFENHIAMTRAAQMFGFQGEAMPVQQVLANVDVIVRYADGL